MRHQPPEIGRERRPDGVAERSLEPELGRDRREQSPSGVGRHRPLEVGLVREVPVDHRAPHAGGGGDRAHADRGTRHPDQVEPGGDEPRAACLPVTGPPHGPPVRALRVDIGGHLTQANREYLFQRVTPNEATMTIAPLPQRSAGRGPVATTRKMLSIARYARTRDYPTFFLHMASVAPRVGYVRAPLQPFWVLSHPELVHEVLVTRGSIMEKGPTAGILNGLLGEGLVTAPRAIQKTQRRLIQPAFTVTGCAAMNN